MIKNGHRYPWVTHPGSDIAPPNDPLSAFQFSSLATIETDSAGSNDMTLVGTGQVGSGVNGNAAKWTSSSAYMSTSGLVTGDFSASGWCRATGLTGTGTSTVSPARFVAGVTQQIYVTVTDGSVADGYYDVAITYVDGSHNGGATFYVADEDWFFWCIVCDMGHSLICQVDDEIQTITHQAPNWHTSMTGDINIISTYASGNGSEMFTDEFYAWDADLLTTAERSWLRNGGTGNFYPF